MDRGKGKGTSVHTAVYVPKHYMQGNMECIDAMVAVFGKEAVATYCRMNAFKYLWRMHDKDSVEMNVMKAVWFLQFSIRPRASARSTRRASFASRQGRSPPAAKS